MTLAIHYASTGTKSSGEILGIDVAVDSLVRAWFRYGGQERFLYLPASVQSSAHFQQLAQEEGIDAKARCIGLDPRTPQHSLRTISCLFQPDPLLSDLAWRRGQVKGEGFALCGLVHTLSGSQIAAAVSNLSIAPVDGCDALICTSRAAKSAVENLWAIHDDYLNQRFGSSFRCPVQTPIIPLGIDTRRVAAKTTPERRKAQRQALGIGDDESVILFVGRLNFISKAHPLPLMMAAEKAAARSRRKLHLVFYGSFSPGDMAARFKNLARDFCRTVSCDFIANDGPHFPDVPWAAADIFASLVDNVQESFGLTPLEAMAAGLPVVASDWDGYRDTVRDGIDGLLVKTLMPPAAAGQEIAQLFFDERDYGAYLVGAAQSTALDIEQAAQALAVLADDDERRLSMGNAGRARAEETYDWSVIIPTYKALWDELAQGRRAARADTPFLARGPAAHPAFPNPFAMFDAHPSDILDPADRLEAVMTEEDARLLLRHDMNLFVPGLLPGPENLLALAEMIRQSRTLSIGEILARYAAAEQPRVWRGVGWLLKHGVCVRAR